MDRKDYIKIKWQEGTIPKNGRNGAQIEDAIMVVIERLDELNAGIPDKFNVDTKRYLYYAMRSQQKRKEDRKTRGVEGTMKK